MKLQVKKGLDIPLKGKPFSNHEALATSSHISLSLDTFEDIRFKLLCKVDDLVAIGQPLAENKAIEGQFFVSPAAGKIVEIRRGIKRRITDIVIAVQEKEENYPHSPLSISSSSQEEIIHYFLRSGIFSHIRMRPLNLVAKPHLFPRDIFVKAIESLPYTPSAESQVEGNEKFFQAGLEALQKLTKGKVHLVYREGSLCQAFTDASHVERHQISGPHPAGSISFAIHKIAPIRHSNDVVWTLSTLDVIVVGRMIVEGRYHINRKVAVAGEGVQEQGRKIYDTRMGISLSHLAGKYIENQPLRIISGDPLTGRETSLEGFLGFEDTCLSILIENHIRERLHFFSLGFDKFTATRCYASGLLDTNKAYSFTTNQHGEERAFIDGRVYNRVMPMAIPTMLLVKAILAEDFDLAEELGLLEVVPEDFALPSFICPSKIEMVDIVKQGQKRYAQEIGMM